MNQPSGQGLEWPPAHHFLHCTSLYIHAEFDDDASGDAFDDDASGDQPRLVVVGRRHAVVLGPEVK